MNVNRIIGASLLNWVLGFLFMMLTCGWLFTWVYELSPKIWMSAEVMQSMSTMVAMALFGLFSALLFSAVFALLYKGIPKSGANKGLVYGFLV